jgi:AcrR family transcriptional regulator
MNIESTKNPPPQDIRVSSLADRLVQAALDLLASEGIDALTLRSVARRAGVSHAAPARHFRSLSDLRAEVAAVGYRRLSEAIEKSDASLVPGAGPMPRLIAAGRAYVNCAIADPGLFALMFRPGDHDPENASLLRDSRAAFERLLEHVRLAQDAGWHEDRDSLLLAGSMWASVHGLATLWVQGAYSTAIPHASLEDALSITLNLTHNLTHNLTQNAPKEN